MQPIEFGQKLRAEKEASFAGAPMSPPPGAMTDGAPTGSPNMFGMSTTDNFHPAPTPGTMIHDLRGPLAAAPHMSRSGWQPGGLLPPGTPSQGLRIPPGGLSGLLKRPNMNTPGPAQQMSGVPIKNDVGDMLNNNFANEGGRMNMGMGDMAMNTDGANKVASALVAMAMYRAAEMEKESSRALKILGALGTGAKNFDIGAGHLLRGVGGMLGGAGYAGRAVGAGARMAGRNIQAAGNAVLNNVTRVPNRILGTGAGGVIRDVGRVGGHVAGGAGAAASLAGKATSLVGQGLQGAGGALNYASQIPGVRTLAAVPVVAGGAMAAKPFVPNVGVQNPIANMSANFRSPVTVNWDKK